MQTHMCIIHMLATYRHLQHTDMMRIHTLTKTCHNHLFTYLRPTTHHTPHTTQEGLTIDVHLNKRPLLALLPDNYIGDAVNTTMHVASSKQGGSQQGGGPAGPPLTGSRQGPVMGKIVLRKKVFRKGDKAPSNAEHLALAYGQVCVCGGGWGLG